MNRGDLAVEHNDVEGALHEYSSAEAMFPDNLEMKFWHAVALVNAGRVQESLPLFREIFAKDRNWLALLPRLPQAGVLRNDEDVLQLIMTAALGK
jgi:predicted Zn-dependent protease